MSIVRSISSLYLLAHLMHFLMLLKGTHHREIRVLNNFKAFSDYIWNARRTDRCVEFRSNASFEWFCFPQMPIIALLLGFVFPLFFGYLYFGNVDVLSQYSVSFSDTFKAHVSANVCTWTLLLGASVILSPGYIVQI